MGYFWPSTCSTCDQLIFIGVSYEIENWILQILWGNDLKFDCLTNHILSLRSYTLPSCSSIWITSKSCKGLWFLLIQIIVSTWPSDDKQTKLLVVTKAIFYWNIILLFVWAQETWQELCLFHYGTDRTPWLHGGSRPQTTWDWVISLFNMLGECDRVGCDGRHNINMEFFISIYKRVNEARKLRLVFHNFSPADNHRSCCVLPKSLMTFS